MNTDSKVFETDFRKWYRYSQSAKDGLQTNRLKWVVRNLESNFGFSFNQLTTDNEASYCFTENYNPLPLQLNAKTRLEFIDYLSEQYPEEEVNPNQVIIPDSPNAGTNKFNQDRISNEIKTANVSSIFYKLTNFISDEKKPVHALRFSLVTLAITQFNILPGNLGDVKFGDWALYLFFGIYFLIWVWCIQSYSKRYVNLKSYQEIFTPTFWYGMFFFLFAFMEVFLIDFFEDGDFPWFAYIMITLFSQFVAIILTLFSTMAMYFIKGGKVMSVPVGEK